MTELDRDLPPQVLAALQRGQKIEAIKLLRELKGMGLKEAKEAVDGHKPRQQPSDVSVVQPGGHGGIFWLLGLLVLGFAAAWLFSGF